jgi:biopolymer transport protein ExbD
MALGSPAGAGRNGRRKIMAEINVTPLTDVFLVLLIIFMITTSVMVKPAADVDLPETSEEQEETQGVMVTMTPSREICVDDRPVPRDDASLVSALKDSLDRSREKVVILAGDREVVLGEVVRVLGLAKEAGASGFALASE